jgi:uncharacterized protein
MQENQIENLYNTDCIRTHSGKYINILDVKPDDFIIEDIAHGLSNVCRFAGHTPKFYSVAEHSIAVAHMCSRENKLAGLLHDASEAYLGDIPSPYKKHIVGYREAEDRFMKAIASKFGFEYPLNENVKQQDNTQLEKEWRNLIIGENDNKIICYSPMKAKYLFLRLYRLLTK